MTTFHPQQSDRGRCAHQKAGTSTLQISVTNCTTKLRAQIHEAGKVVCNKLQGAVQEQVIELSFYTREAEPLRNRRILRLAQISPLAVRSPARRSRDVREVTGKTSGEISRVMSAQLPGNGRSVAAAMPPSVRQDDSQDSLPCAGRGRAMSTPETCETTRNPVAQQPCRSPHDGQRNISQVTCRILGVSF